jgi:hypothetical protein
MYTLKGHHHNAKHVFRSRLSNEQQQGIYKSRGKRVELSTAFSIHTLSHFHPPHTTPTMKLTTVTVTLALCASALAHHGSHSVRTSSQAPARYLPCPM